MSTFCHAERIAGPEEPATFGGLSSTSPEPRGLLDLTRLHFSIFTIFFSKISLDKKTFYPYVILP